MLPAEVKIIIGGPHTHRGWGWGSNTGSINTDAFQHLCVSGQQSDCQQPAGSRKGHWADTGGHTQQTLMTVGDLMIVQHYVK